jgi:hypothetical protein
MTADDLGPATYGAVLALNGIAVVVVQPVAVRLPAGRTGTAPPNRRARRIPQNERQESSAA